MQYRLKDNLTLKDLKDNKFILKNNAIRYEISWGIYLSFDYADLKYAGVEIHYLTEMEEIKEKEKQGLERLKKLCLIEKIEE